MDTATWMQMGGVAGLGAALLAGFLFSFTPVAFASIPVILAYVTRARAFREAVSYGLAFAAGLILTHVVLGVGAALGGFMGTKSIEPSVGRCAGSITDPARSALDGLAKYSIALAAAAWQTRRHALGCLLARDAFHRGHLPGVLTGAVGRPGCQCLYRFGGLWWLADAGFCAWAGDPPRGGCREHRLAGKLANHWALASRF
jgi:hypothetical protein